MKVFLISPRRQTMYGGKAAFPDHPPVGLAALSAFLKKEGIDVAVFDYGIYRDGDLLVGQISKFSPDLIGVTVLSYCLKSACGVISGIKERFSIPVVIGGPHVSAIRGEALNQTSADFAVKGEGELTLLELCKEIAGDQKFSSVDGLIYKEKGAVIENGDRNPMLELDNLPFPDYESFQLKKYPCFKTRILPIITSRGCPYNCNYCSVKLSMGKRFRAYSPKRVIEEIEYWTSKGWRNFDFNDDCFSLDLKRAEDICNLIIKNGLNIKYQLYNGIRVDRIDESLLRKMKNSGCTFVSFGCESGDKNVLKNIKKGITLKQVRRASDLANKTGIRHSVNFIIGHPGETYDSAMASLEFAKSLPSDYINFYNLIPYPGTELYDWIEKHGKWLFSKESYLEEVSYRNSCPVFETPEFTAKQRQAVMKKCFGYFERKAMQFRMGKLIGTVIFALTRINFLHAIANYLVFSNQLGKHFFITITRKSRS